MSNRGFQSQRGQFRNTELVAEIPKTYLCWAKKVIMAAFNHNKMIHMQKVMIYYNMLYVIIKFGLHDKTLKFISIHEIFPEPSASKLI